MPESEIVAFDPKLKRTFGNSTLGIGVVMESGMNDILQVLKGTLVTGAPRPFRDGGGSSIVKECDFEYYKQVGRPACVNIIAMDIIVAMNNTFGGFKVHVCK